MAFYKKKSSGPTLQDLVNSDLKTGEFKGVYVFEGDDALRIGAVVDKIRKDVLGEAGSAFNYHVLHGDNVPAAKIIQQALTLPMMAGRQVIWVKNADSCLGDQASQGQMEKYLDKPVAETILILAMDKVDKRKKWAKLCVSKGYIYDFSPPEGDALIQWIIKMAKKEGLALDRQGSMMLADLVGDDLMSLKNEIDKLALVADVQGGKLDAEALSKIIMDQAQLSGFDITEHLMPGQTAKALKTWYRMSEWGKTAYEISPLLVSRVRKAAILSNGRQAGMADQEIGSLTGTNPWSFKFLTPLVKGLGPQGVRDALKTALECDVRLKSSPLKPDIIFEKAIMDLCKDRR
jgi:DNA polymerase III subunit delta